MWQRLARLKKTIDPAPTFAEVGYLRLCTFHANNANQLLDRLLQFPAAH
jgi:twitching motility protein PilU